MRIAIVGVGDYGSRFAAWLIRAGYDVTLIARGKSLNRLQTEGLTATQGTVTSEVHIDHVHATDDPARVGPVDLVLMCVKLYQLDDAMEAASPLVGPNTTVMGVQNGITAEDRLIRRFGASHVIGVAASAGSIPLSIGELPCGTSDRTAKIVQVFKKADINIEENTNIIEALWGKFLVVCGAAVCALSRQSVGGVVNVPELRQLASMAVEEALGLAKAKGILLENNQIAKIHGIWEEVAVTNPSWRPSLLQDLEAGKPLELDAWSGGAVAIGKELGMPTPVNFTIYAGLKPYEQGRP